MVKISTVSSKGVFGDWVSAKLLFFNERNALSVLQILGTQYLMGECVSQWLFCSMVPLVF